MKTILVTLALSAHLIAQPWSGIIAPARAVDWSAIGVGIPGGIPSSSWTQCTTVAPYGTSGTPASPATINTALSGCANNTYVTLTAGTFYLNAAIQVPSQHEVRGQGADTTFVVFSGFTSCSGKFYTVCMNGANYDSSVPQHSATWSAGYSQGATSITLSSVTGIVTNQTVITLFQQDETSDTGNIWNCGATACGSANYGGAAYCVNATQTCSQQQEVVATAISGAGPYTVTITPALAMPNWRSGQSPGAFWGDSGYQKGIENISLDVSGAGSGTAGIYMQACYQCWIRGVRVLDPGTRNHVGLQFCLQCVVRDSYFYENQSHSTVSYAIELTSTSNSLVENDICHRSTDSCPSNTGGGVYNVAAYNYAVDAVYSNGWFQTTEYEHASGDGFWLWEGNIATGHIADAIHGTHHFITLFRGLYLGNQVAGCVSAALGACINNMVPVQFFGGSRYFQIIGSVLGMVGYHNAYQSIGWDGLNNAPNGTIYYIASGVGQGGSGTWCSSTALAAGNCGTTNSGGTDTLTNTSLMRWGNYDVFNAAVQWNSSEVPSAFGDTTGTTSAYVNPVPASHTLPASFLHTSKPSWWGNSVPWPAIGPDVTSGTLGVCTSGNYTGMPALSSGACAGGSFTASAYGGHANPNPAMSCFVSTMGGNPGGTNNLLTFNADTCYPATSSATPSVHGGSFSVSGNVTQ